MKKTIFVSLLCLNLMSASAFAQSRMESVISDSARIELDLISSLQKEIARGEVQLNILDQDLATAAKNNRGHEIFLKTRNAAGITTLVGVATLGIGLAVVNFAKAGPSGPRGWGAVGAMYGGILVAVAGSVAVVSEAGVLLTKSEADTIRASIKELKSITIIRKKELKREITLLCKQEPTHQLCY